jgi:hypothetical protein
METTGVFIITAASTKSLGGVALRNNMSRSRNVITALAVFGGGMLSGGHAAHATPSTLGFYPSTDIVPKKIFHLDVDTYGRALRTDVGTTVGLTTGIGPDRSGILGRTEIGADYIIGGPLTAVQSSSRRLTFNVKTQLFENTDSATRVVAGVWGVGSNTIAAPDVAYVLGSKAFDFGRISVGLAHATANRDNVTTPSGNSDRTYLQLGYDKVITSKFSVAVDFYSGKSAISGVQPTVYYAVNDKASFGLGLFRLNDSSIAPRNQVYACFDYNFGGGSTSEPGAPEPAIAPQPAPAG